MVSLVVSAVGLAILQYVVPAILAGIAGFIGVSSTNRTNVANTNAINELQQQLAGQSNNWQEQMWMRQNAYNDPKSQVSRLAGANLNTAMMMSQGGIMNEAGSAGQANMPVMSVPQVHNPIDPAVASQIALNTAQAAKIGEETEDIRATRAARIANLMSAVTAADAQMQDVVSKIQQRIHQNALTDAERENISFEQMFKKNQLAIDWKRVQNETKLTDQQIETLKADMTKKLAEARVTNREYYEMVHTFALRKAGLEKQNNLTDAKIEEARATAKKLGIEGERLNQLISIDSPKAQRGQSIVDAANSDDPITMVLGQAMLAIDYAIDGFGGALLGI